MLAAEPIDVVLLDLSLPDAERLEGVEAVTAAAPEIPVVVTTGLADDEVALAAVKTGAQDYLIKGEDGPRVVRRAIRYARERQELLARTRAASAPVWVNVDVDRLVQALGNLVSNAIRFTPRGGRVTVSASAGGDGAAVFRVRDMGPGVAPEHLPHLFHRFWQAHATRRGGAGLGLAIAKGIVEAHGGRIGVESTLGAGATFTCAVPAGGP